MSRMRREASHSAFLFSRNGGTYLDTHLYQYIVQHHPESLCILDLQGRFIDANLAFEKLSGYRRTDIIRRNFSDLFIDPEEKAASLAVYQSLLLEGAPCTNTFQACSQSGVIIDVSITTVPLVTSGHTVGLFAVVKDITLQTALAERLQEVESAYEALQKHASDAIALHTDRVWLSLNGSALALFGANQSADLIGKPIDLCLPADCKHAYTAACDRLMAGESTVEQIEQVWVTPTGRNLHTECTLLPVGHQKNRCIHVIIHDVSERKASEERLINSEKLSAIGQLAAAVAHEVRNPLTTLKGFTQLLYRKSRQPNKRYYEIMLTELKRVELILSQMLVLAKPQLTAVSPRDIALIIEEVIALMEAQAHLSNISVTFKTTGKVGAVLCDEVQIKQVFLNIIKNAMEAMPSGGTLAVQLTCTSTAVQIAFTDQGVGIPPEHLSRLGDPFFSTKAQGTGLGLMVCRRMIERHGGALDIVSQVGVGTTVTVTLPEVR